jgi:hypothetical protein
MIDGKEPGMVTSDSLRTLGRRAYRHALEDGAADIVVGIYTITVGTATQNRALLALAVVYLVVYALAWRWLHDRISSRRTGYAEVKEQPPRVLLTGTLAAGALTLLVVAAITLSTGRLWNLEHWPRWMPILAGIILAAGFLQTAIRSALGRYRGYAMLALAGSLFFWLFPFAPSINPSDRLTLFLFLVGGVMAITGVVVGLRFRRLHPVLRVEAHDGQG